MTTELLIKCLEEAAELGDRFPDLPDFDVLEHVTHVCELSDYLREEWAISRCVIAAYNTAPAGFIQDEAIDTGIDVAKAWGLIANDYKHNHYV